MQTYYEQSNLRLWHADNRDVLPLLEENSVDACLTDPPYELTSIQKRFGKPDSAACQVGKDGAFRRVSRGFMGKTWDGTGIQRDPEYWKLVYRVLKPGAYLLAFGGTRTYHRMACAVEDAGFDVRDMLAWVHGQGFPKNRNLGHGRGTALKPALEPLALARKPISESSVAANVQRWGTGGLNIGVSRIPTGHEAPADGRWPANVLHDGSEPVLEEFAKYGEAARFFACYPHGDEDMPAPFRYCPKPSRAERNRGTHSGEQAVVSMGAAPHECEDADWADRNGNRHATVKPVALCAYFARLICPPGGLLLDPFMGSGSIGVAAMREGFGYVGIEMEEESVITARKRLADALHLVGLFAEEE